MTKCDVIGCGDTFKDTIVGKIEHDWHMIFRHSPEQVNQAPEVRV